MKTLRNPRYSRVHEITKQFQLEHPKALEFPVNIDDLIRESGLRLIPYSVQLKRESDKQINAFLKAFPDAVLFRNGLKILYNDWNIRDEYERKRMRFTLAHELGHFILGHIFEFNLDNTLKQNNSLSDLLELETNVFACNILCPAHCVTTLNFKNVNDIINYFDISTEFAEKRINYMKYDLYRGLPSNKFEKLKLLEMSTYFCKTCNSELIFDSQPNFCPICGQSNTLFNKLINGITFYINNIRRNNKIMIYQGIEVDDNSKAIVCPICENEEILDGSHCHICGKNIVNRCSNYDDYNSYYNECGQLLPGNARFCPKCGAESKFLQNGLLKRWDLEHEEQNGKALNWESEIFEDTPPYKINIDDIPF